MTITCKIIKNNAYIAYNMLYIYTVKSSLNNDLT